MSDKQSLPTYINELSPTSFTDGFKIAIDKEHSMLLLQLLSATPEAVIENHRTKMSKAGVVKLIEALCSAIDYYPNKTVTTDKKTRKVSAKKGE